MGKLSEDNLRPAYPVFCILYEHEEYEKLL